MWSRHLLRRKDERKELCLPMFAFRSFLTRHDLDSYFLSKIKWCSEELEILENMLSSFYVTIAY